MATAKKPVRAKGAKAGKGAKSEDMIEDAVVLKEPVKPAKDKVENKPADTEQAPNDANPKSGFIPMLVGGVLSGAIGFGAASYYFMNRPSDVEQNIAKVQATLESQQTALKDVSAQVGGLPDALAGAKTEAKEAVAALATATGSKDEELSATLANLANKLEDIDTRLTTLEKRPVAEGGMTSEAAAAYERELQNMRDLLATQKADIEKLAAEATARIEGVAQLGGRGRKKRRGNSQSDGRQSGGRTVAIGAGQWRRVRSHSHEFGRCRCECSTGAKGRSQGRRADFAGFAGIIS
ncbi:hypothetical protein [Profundibacter sp.]|uniref:hypothetical protein n=1 Tax=Profundibacter sp. TaxID=3101071 RepID=UPI003D1265DF